MKSMHLNTSLHPIFDLLKGEKIPPLDQYDELLAVMKKLDSKYTDFKSYEQGLITVKFLKGENVFGVLPTSGGKSLTFQTVARMTEGLTIVISPLISLMKDQVAKHRDGESLYFNSELSPSLRREVKRRIKSSKVRLLYISPERLKSEEFKELLDSSSQRVKRFVIDEAHCVIEWGYSFRVKYLHIAQEIEAFEKRLGDKIPVLLLTATASPWLQRETAKKLRIRIPAKNFITQFEGADRPELRVATKLMKSDQEKIKWLSNQFKKGKPFYHKRGIIFSAYAEGGETKESYNASKIYDGLKALGVQKIGYYHGQMDLEERKEIQKNFQNGKLDILVATKAFGMGIDLPGLKFIVHFYPPISLEEYWQEAGRGGRGLNLHKNEYCDCVVLYSPEDKNRLNNFTISKSFVNILSTFTSVTQDVFCFNGLPDRGALRALLMELRKRKDMRQLKSISIGGSSIERWKLLKPASRVLAHIDTLLQKGVIKNTKQIRRRLINQLNLRDKRNGKNIQVGKRESHFNADLNWFTEPEIEALAMLDDKPTETENYTRFKILKPDLSLDEIKIVAKKVNVLRSNIKNKFEYVHSHFLKAKPGKEKGVILKYLSGK